MWGTQLFALVREAARVRAGSARVRTAIAWVERSLAEYEFATRFK
jgi:hypothetical protein